ncbi:MAG TPA: hypothetical protein VH082_06865 [Rudaea sp.]|nr:hypothetical protein [Rudaea sp.]
MPTKRFARFRGNILKQIGAQLGDDARACIDIDWCGVRCPTAVGLMRGIVHKVAIVVTSARNESVDLLGEVAAYIERHLDSHPTTAVDGLLIFDGEGGNVVVQETVGTSPAQVVVYVTSSDTATLASVALSNQKRKCTPTEK